MALLPLDTVTVTQILRISPYSVRMWENADQSNSEHRHFSRKSVSKLNVHEMFNSRPVSSGLNTDLEKCEIKILCIFKTFSNKVRTPTIEAISISNIY